RVQCGGGRGATTERLPCKPEDLGSSPGSVTFSLHSSLVTIYITYIVHIYIVYLDVLFILLHFDKCSIFNINSLRNSKGKPLLKYKGFLHYKDKTYDTKVYWKCEHFNVLKCRGRFVTENERVIKYTDRDHSGNPLDTEKRAVINDLKSITKNSTASIHSIIADVLPTTSDSVKIFLPKNSSLKRSLRRVRENENKDELIPDSLKDFIVPESLTRTLNNKQFLYYDSGSDDDSRIIIFTTNTNLKALKSLSALAFVPVNKVSETFEEIIQELFAGIENQNVDEYLQYFQKTYIYEKSLQNILQM
ncbi:hypothetical protein TSAR_013772, partial [Trichomalopsis sarcophagae]